MLILQRNWPSLSLENKKQSSKTLLKALQQSVAGQRMHDAYRFLSSHPDYLVTPMYSQAGLAKMLGIHSLIVKDETRRYFFNDYQLTGDLFVAGKLFAKLLNEEFKALTFSSVEHMQRQIHQSGLRLISTFDEQNGKKYDWIARQFQLPHTVYVTKDTPIAVIQEIQGEGNSVVRTLCDEVSLRDYCRNLAQEEGAFFLQDILAEHGEEVRQWQVQGYSVVAKEILDTLSFPPTHIVLQADEVISGAMIAAFHKYYEENMPRVVLVRSSSTPDPEEEVAQLLLDSFDVITGDGAVAGLGMRIYGNPVGQDTRMVASLSSAISLGALAELCWEKPYTELRQHLGLDESARVLLINTEGERNQQKYRDIVWQGKFPTVKA